AGARPLHATAGADGAFPDLRPRRDPPPGADQGRQRCARADGLEVVVSAAELVSAAEFVVATAEVVTAVRTLGLARAHGGECGDEAAQCGLAAVGADRVWGRVARQQGRRPLAALVASVPRSEERRVG